MEAPPVIQRQRPGIKSQQTTITLPGDEMTRLRQEAYEQKITVSMHVINLVRKAWDQEGRVAA